jgi:hypothetical protein
VGAKIPVKIICPLHGEFMQTPFHHIKQVSECPICGIIKRNKSLESNTDEFIKKAKKIHGDKYDYSLVDYKNSKTPVTIKCKKHGNFQQTPNKHLLNQGCPKCQESTGQKLVRSILELNKIIFIEEKKFQDCKNTLKGRACVMLPFDFYLPNNNTIIEYDGVQHFKPSFGEKSFEITTRNDKQKNKYCKKNGIKLIRIPYTMKKEEIEPYILKELGIK